MNQNNQLGKKEKENRQSCIHLYLYKNKFSQPESLLKTLIHPTCTLQQEYFFKGVGGGGGLTTLPSPSPTHFLSAREQWFLVCFFSLKKCQLQNELLLQYYWLNPFSTRPHQNVVWYNNSCLGFLKILNYVPKERKKNLPKMSPHLSQLNIAMAHRNYFRRNNLRILKLATYTKIADHYSRCKLATF